MFVLLECNQKEYNEMWNNKTDETLQRKQQQQSKQPASVFRDEANFGFWLCNKASQVRSEPNRAFLSTHFQVCLKIYLR